MVSAISLEQRVLDTRRRAGNDTVRTVANCQAIADSLTRDELWDLGALLRSDPDSQLRNLGADISAMWFVRTVPDTQDQWPELLTEWLTYLRTGDDTDAFEIASSAITWKLRHERPRCLNALKRSRVLQELEEGSEHFHTDLSLLLQAARYDFNFLRIRQLLETVGEKVTNESPYYRAMWQFSRLGRGKDVPPAEISAIAADTDSQKVLSLLLHGLWFTAGAEESQQMLELCDRLLAINPYDPVTYMRQAAAYRRKGDFVAAIAAINTAIDLHSPLDRETHNDLKLERVTIATQQDEVLRLQRVVDASSARLNTTISAVTDDIDARVTDADHRLTTRFTDLADDTSAQVSDSLFKVVEILGIFTAIIGAGAAAVSAAVGDGLPWWGRALIILSGGAVMVAFFALLRLIVRPPRTSPAPALAPAPAAAAIPSPLSDAETGAHA